MRQLPAWVGRRCGRGMVRIVWRLELRLRPLGPSLRGSMVDAAGALLLDTVQRSARIPFGALTAWGTAIGPVSVEMLGVPSACSITLLLRHCPASTPFIHLHVKPTLMPRFPPRRSNVTPGRRLFLLLLVLQPQLRWHFSLSLLRKPSCYALSCKAWLRCRW